MPQTTVGIYAALARYRDNKKEDMKPRIIKYMFIVWYCSSSHIILQNHAWIGFSKNEYSRDKLLYRDLCPTMTNLFVGLFFTIVTCA